MLPASGKGECEFIFIKKMLFKHQDCVGVQSAVLNADLDASYDKEESFYKDEDLESPRARAC